MQSPRRTAGLSGSELAEGLGAQRAVELQILLFCLALALDTPPAELEPGALEGIARFAVTAASLSTLRPGGISSIPTEAEVLAALEE